MLDERAFVEAACPHSWLRTADSLYEQANNLYQKRQASRLVRYDASGRVTLEQPRINKSVFLLGGFALENAIKAFLVYENPEWVSNGRLSSKLRSHKLTELQALSAHIPFKNRYRWVLQSFEDGLDSWARYPCSLSMNTIVEESVISSDLWAAYNRLMRAYGQKLMLLLRKEWSGPHGFRARYTFDSAFLVMCEPVSEWEKVRTRLIATARRRQRW